MLSRFWLSADERIATGLCQELTKMKSAGMSQLVAGTGPTSTIK
jgi:hypothetical protein